MLKIVHIESEQHLGQIRELFREYVASLGFELDFQDFKKEFDNLPGEYARPTGYLLLAYYDGEVAGCVALRKFKDDICEMKRLYVRPRFRGQGIGRKLAKEIIRQARDAGYRCMRLDTIETMKQANALYKSMGFREVKAYRFNPINGAKFFELDLTKIPDNVINTNQEFL
jgi:putative acetyltransferase